MTPPVAADLTARARALAHEFSRLEDGFDARAEYPKQNIDSLFDAGLFAATLPRELGGLEISLAEYCEIVRQLARGSPSTALLYVMPSALVAVARIPAALVPEVHRETFRTQMRWIADEVESRKIFAVANSEPGAGGKLSETRTAAVAGDGAIRISGRKSFCTFGRHADYLMCAARDEESLVDEYLVASDAAGLSFSADWNPLGMRSTESVSAVLTDAPAVGLLGYPGMLDRVSARHWSTLGFAATFLGAGEALFEAARASAGAARTACRLWLAEFRIFLDTTAALVNFVATRETWPPTSEWKREASLAKTAVTQGVAGHAVRMLISGGGAAYVGHGPVQRLFRDVLAGPFLRPPLPLALDEIAAKISPAAPVA